MTKEKLVELGLTEEQAVDVIKEFDELKKIAVDVEELKKTHEAEMNQLRLDNAIDNALSAAGAKNAKAVRALLNDKNISLGEDGKVAGLDDQIAALQKSDAYMFHDKTVKFKSFQPGVGVDIRRLEGLEEDVAMRRAFGLPSAGLIRKDNE